MNDRRAILRDSLIGTAGCALILLLKMLRSDGGVLGSESYGFLIHYTQSRPFWAMIFDPHVNDWGFYQARELSYFFDWLDVQFIVASQRAGWMHFYSAVNFTAFVLTAGILQYTGRMLFRRLSPLIITLGTVLLMLSPATGELIFFRSAKPLVMLLAVLCCALFAFYFRRPRRIEIAGILISLLLLNMLDRQGAFFVAAFAVSMGLLLVAGALRWRNFRRRGFVVLALGSFLCVMAGAAYNTYIAPGIIFALNDYYPSLEYQRIDDLTLNGIVLYGGYFLAGNIGHNLTGMIGLWAVPGGLVAMAAQWFACRSRWIRLVLVAAWAAMIGCAGAMVIRHLSIMLPDVMYANYFCIMLAVLILLAWLSAGGMSVRGRRIFALVLGIAVAVQLWLTLFPIPLRSHQMVYRDKGPLVLRALRDDSFDYRREVMPHHMLRLIDHLKGRRRTDLQL